MADNEAAAGEGEAILAPAEQTVTTAPEAGADAPADPNPLVSATDAPADAPADAHADAPAADGTDGAAEENGKVGLFKLPPLLKAEDIPPVRARLELSEFPEAYWSNSHKEDMVLGFVGNFNRQFRLLYNNRKPLFVTPHNECGVRKFVCTTVRPSLLPYRHLYNHEGASEFVADYITYELLEPATEPPEVLNSPTSTLWNQRGNCFDLAVLLCSLLEGAGFDAYCVHGYATREVCFADRSRRDVEDEDNRVVAKPQVETKKPNKYALKPPSNLNSDYDKKMLQREAAEKLEADATAKTEADKARRDRLRPAHDKLGGIRVHSWVVVLRGKRNVPETFFIEPTLGEAVSAQSSDYHGIEAVWNSQNYWVNMQDCMEGVAGMNFDLGDSSAWEYVFPQVEQPIVGKEGTEGNGNTKDGEVLDLPKTWVNELTLAPQDFETRCPHGQRTLIELETKTEIFAEYKKPDGMVKRVTRYADAEMTIRTKVVSTFAQRKDQLIRRTSTFTEGTGTEQVDEMYLPGRVGKEEAEDSGSATEGEVLDIPKTWVNDQLKHHTYFRKHRVVDPLGGRKLHFYHDARVDGLCTREDANGQLCETFSGRDDFLVKRSVDFAGGEGGDGHARHAKAKSVNINVDDDASTSERVVVEMTETYLRNPAIPAAEDFKDVSFLDDMIYVTYHRDDRQITAQTRELEKPQLTEKQQYPPIQQDEVTTFKVDPKQPQHLRNFENQQLLDKLLGMEVKCRKSVTASLAETGDILKRLEKDNAEPELVLSFYDTTRNAKSKARREKLEEEARQEQARRELMERDYLAPFLVQQIEPDKLTDDMYERVQALLAKGRFASNWKSSDGWAEVLMNLYNLEIDVFLSESQFNPDDKKDLRLCRERQKAESIKKQCLEDLELRLMRQAKLIQDWYEREQNQLQKRKEWYEKNQTSLKLEEKEEYANFCDEVLFRLKILDQRLQRHKDDAPRQYVKLDHTLRNDMRLAEFLVKNN